jgi:probable rRNA maturation factor
MTFPDGSADPASGRLLLGDLAVCVDVAAREAKARGRPLADELTLYCLHGLLHLIGYDDVTAAKQKRMWNAQRRLLASEGIVIEATPS